MAGTFNMNQLELEMYVYDISTYFQSLKHNIWELFMILEGSSGHQVLQFVPQVLRIRMKNRGGQWKKPKGWLGFIGDYTTQLYRGLN